MRTGPDLSYEPTPDGAVYRGRRASIASIVVLTIAGMAFLLQPGARVGAPPAAPSPAPTTGAPASAVPARQPATDMTSAPLRPSRDIDTLVAELDRAEADIQSAGSSATRLAAAGRYEQLATRRLLRLPPAVRARVLARLEPQAAATMRANLSAATQLGGLTEPEPRYPAWRIVAPPPPAVLLQLYRDAERASGVPWEYLAAINLVETRMGRIRGASTAGAQGPMQFMPGTWAMYGHGSANSYRESILAAARLLRANGAPRNMSAAIYHYNLSMRYVRAVSAYAERMRASPRTYQGYYHWQVLYRHVHGTALLPVGYPGVRPVLVE